MDPYPRELPGKTLTTLKKEVDDKLESVQLLHSEIEVDLVRDEPRVKLTSADIEVPATPAGLSALGAKLDVPVKFLDRLDPDLQQHLLQTLLERDAGTATVMFNDDGIAMVRDPKNKYIAPAKLINIAAKVIATKAPVVDYLHTPDAFEVDVMVPEAFDRGIGGDRKAGDLSHAGVTFGIDYKHNLAPFVQPFQFRLSCGNGQIGPKEEGHKVDARGATVEQVLAEFEALADRAFRRAERSIDAFYELRTRKVDNPERTLARLAREHGMPDRTFTTLVKGAAAIDGDVTEFDLVNLITNQANAPGLQNKWGVRRNLQQVGGAIVSEHVQRCAHCQARLN